jgi:hypothetical protein
MPWRPTAPGSRGAAVHGAFYMSRRPSAAVGCSRLGGGTSSATLMSTAKGTWWIENRVLQDLFTVELEPGANLRRAKRAVRFSASLSGEPRGLS